ncbi:MAG: 2-oxoacid:acceptor oxidoreductase subunit alpha [Thermofilaceae archaeon]
MAAKELAVLVGGPAGSGVFATGAIAARALLYHGYSVFATNEYPSTIRGGHQWVLVRGRLGENVYAHCRSIDALLALDAETIRLHEARLGGRGVVVCDESVAKGLCSNARIVALGLREVVEKAGAPPVAVNVAGLSALLAMMGARLEPILEAVKSYYRGRERLAELNVRVATMAYELGVKLEALSSLKLKYEPRGGRLLLDGNSAVALGALAGGMSFFAAYPITPASPILHFLAEVQEEVGAIVVQAECELAAINMAVGAAYAGARAVVATSGPGFSLMAEALGEAAMTETPIVVVNVQRAGPSTGLPTHTAQGDLRFAIHASHGEFPRVVLAPGDPVEAYQLTCEALNLAWRYQVPVILLTDKYLGESYWTIDGLPKVEPDEGSIIVGEAPAGYARYRVTDDGVSPMLLPGTRGARVYANANEHDEEGFVTVDPETVRRMQEKRFRKLRMLRALAEERGVKVYGSGRVALLVWGSTKMVALEALRELEGVKLVQVVWLEPFPAQSLGRELEGCRVLVAENNATGQLASLVREHLLREPDSLLLRYDGRQLEPEEIVEFVRGGRGG